MRLPVVATRIPGTLDAVQDGFTGILVPPRDPPALAEAIRTYACDPVLRRSHGDAGRERVLRDFRQEALWQALHEYYLEATGRATFDPGPRPESVAAAPAPGASDVRI